MTRRSYISPYIYDDMISTRDHQDDDRGVEAGGAGARLIKRERMLTKEKLNNILSIMTTTFVLTFYIST